MTGVMNVKRCGNCHFGKIIPDNVLQRQCWGLPPTPIPIGASARGVQTVMARPTVAVSDDACALYRGKAEAEIAADTEDMRMLQAVRKQ